MKCIFAATTYQFSVQYHPWASVEANAGKDWLMETDGFRMLYRMLDQPGTDRRSDAGCAVFVPSRHDAGTARLLVEAFRRAHPGVIPAGATFGFVDPPWWKLAPYRFLALSPKPLRGLAGLIVPERRSLPWLRVPLSRPTAPAPEPTGSPR